MPDTYFDYYVISSLQFITSNGINSIQFGAVNKSYSNLLNTTIVNSNGQCLSKITLYAGAYIDRIRFYFNTSLQITNIPIITNNIINYNRSLSPTIKPPTIFIQRISPTKYKDYNKAIIIVIVIIIIFTVILIVLIGFMIKYVNIKNKRKGKEISNVEIGKKIIIQDNKINLVNLVSKVEYKSEGIIKNEERMKSEGKISNIYVTNKIEVGNDKQEINDDDNENLFDNENIIINNGIITTNNDFIFTEPIKEGEAYMLLE